MEEYTDMGESTNDQEQDLVDEQGESTSPESEVDRAKLQRVFAQLELEQNLALGILGGVAAAVIGAILWGIVTVAIEHQIGWMAVGLGFLVGYAVRLLGKGLTKIYGVVGAVCALVGCFMGNLLGVCLYISKENSIPLATIISRLNIPLTVELMKVTFNPIDVLFYAIAVYEGYRFSFRQLKEEDLASLVQKV